ncbi:hypothetical protein ACFSKU_15550 [Pontibacter silvestris]|uniref:Uncharacterized protein n=1 Tax=Pontibacter silvestris TaxID=2305183 RepID=A0ABW4X2C0_9BACT|nr:hypothetical protein [Pontibacter silvestris]MCC9137541.1 hypothetical protein [Pontibacter silvestris]
MGLVSSPPIGTDFPARNRIITSSCPFSAGTDAGQAPGETQAVWRNAFPAVPEGDQEPEM